MEELDSNHDGFISLTEFVAFCHSSFEDGRAFELRNAFQLYDQDQNGLISTTELHLVLNRLGMKCSVEDCHQMIRSVNSYGNGNVNFDEFQKMIQSAALGTIHNDFVNYCLFLGKMLLSQRKYPVKY